MIRILTIFYTSHAMKPVHHAIGLVMKIIIIVYNVLYIIEKILKIQMIVLPLVLIFIIIHFMGNINAVKEVIAQRKHLYIFLKKKNVQMIAVKKKVVTYINMLVVVIKVALHILFFLKIIYVKMMLMITDVN